MIRATAAIASTMPVDWNALSRSPKKATATTLTATSWITADKQRLEQAILNLIKNAIDAMPDGGTISLAGEEDNEHKLVKIRVRDTGVGMDAETAKRIFDPFFTTKEDGKGSGLGLYVAREIVEEHEGSIKVISAEGEGTTFLIRLPIKEAICDGAAE